MGGDEQWHAGRAPYKSDRIRTALIERGYRGESAVAEAMADEGGPRNLLSAKRTQM